MTKKQDTIRTYNESARELATKFETLGARISDIEETFAHIQKENPFVLEIGCGNGRDAAEIIKHTNRYVGMDIAEKLVALAQEKVPQAKFIIADIEDCDIPQGIDIVFAFASLIHVTRENLQIVLKKIHAAMNEDGLVRMSMKASDTYEERTKEDEFGIRTYYHYPLEDIEELATPDFVLLEKHLNHLRGQDWIEVLLQKA